MHKYADDTYIILPATNSHTRETELTSNSGPRTLGPLSPKTWNSTEQNHWK